MTVLNLKALRVHPRILFAGLAIMTAAACSPPPEEEVPVRVEGATAATVNGEKIYVSDVELEAVARGLVPAGAKVKSGDPEYDTVLNQLIEQKLMAQEAFGAVWTRIRRVAGGSKWLRNAFSATCWSKTSSLKT
jgi:peptidyl-prolyl cis-trans isomerase C